MMEDNETSAELGADQESTTLNNIDSALFNTLPPSKRQQRLKRNFDDTTVNGSHDIPDLSLESPVGSASRGWKIHVIELKSCPKIFEDVDVDVILLHQTNRSLAQLCENVSSVLNQIPNTELKKKILELKDTALKEEKNGLGSSDFLIGELINFKILCELRAICVKVYITKCCNGDCTNCKQVKILYEEIEQRLNTFSYILKYPSGLN